MSDDETAAAAGGAVVLPPQIEQAVGLLQGVDGRELADRAEVFDEVHRLLQDSLAEVEGA